MVGELKIIAVCGFGLGSSEILVVNIQKALESLGIKDYHVEAVGLGISSAFDADIIVTSEMFVNDIKRRLGNKNTPIVTIKSFVNLEEIKEKLKNTLKEIGYLKQ